VAIGFFSFSFLANVMEGRFRREVDRVLVDLNSTSTLAGTDAETETESTTNENELPWQPFSLAALQELTDAGHTVFVDFTADWCFTCKTNEKLALNKPETRKFVDENGIVTLVADKSHPNPDADLLLTKLGNHSRLIPYYAIFPAGNPNQPILLDGLITSPKPIIEALKKAGPSLDKRDGESPDRPEVARGEQAAKDAEPG
jgi:thiol:disulfide interchange protein